jgi:2,4-dienoyl-CoA reductase-like NADH-dependent reductase (Old Yellow Enzyme family)
MTRNPRYDLLFEPVRIGPVVSKNRFYQVPHCNGTGDRSAMATAAMRETKTEGGWGVVCAENMMVDAWSDIAPFPAVRLWSDEDIPAQEEMVDRVHHHGALAGCELAHFAAEGHEEDHVSFVKTTTAKPVVGVGRFTSPDTMVSQIRRGVVDLIGAARLAPRAG